MTTVETRGASLEVLDALEGVDAVVCFVPADERPFLGALGWVDWRLCGAVSRVARSGFFVGDPSERLLMPTDARLPVPRLFVVGLGPRDAVTPRGLEHQLKAAATMLTGALVGSAALAFGRLPGDVTSVRDELLARAFAPAFPGRFLVLE